MGLLETFFGTGNDSAQKQTGGYASVIDSLVGPKEEKQPHATTVQSFGRTYQNRTAAVKGIDENDTERGICGDLGCKCKLCGYYAGSKSLLIKHIEDWHK